MKNGVVTVGNTKPYVPNNKADITVESVRKYILTACEKFEYIDFHILHITTEQFTAILLQLEEKIIFRKIFPMQLFLYFVNIVKIFITVR